MHDPRLDRIVLFDERSRAFPIRQTIREEGIKQPRSYTWRCFEQLDQGREGACVGFGWAHELAARPGAVLGITNQSAQSIYHVARTLDPWEGENYEGTAVISGAKAMQQLYPGKIKEYRWCFSLADLVLTVGYLGPVVAGTYWHEGMHRPSSDGIITATGSITGGHCYLVTGGNIRTNMFRIRNSWGSNWGIQGDAFISFSDMEKLLMNQGEGCVPLMRAPEKRRSGLIAA